MKYFKFIILFITAVAFLVPGLLKAQDDPPEITDFDAILSWVADDGGTKPIITLSVTATDEEILKLVRFEHRLEGQASWDSLAELSFNSTDCTKIDERYECTKEIYHTDVLPPSGTHYYRVTIWDKADKSASDTEEVSIVENQTVIGLFTILLDPEIKKTPLTTAVGGSATLILTAKDQDGLNKVVFQHRFEGGAWENLGNAVSCENKTECIIGDFSVSNISPSGKHEYQAIIRDIKNNDKLSGIISVFAEESPLPYIKIDCNKEWFVDDRNSFPVEAFHPDGISYIKIEFLKDGELPIFDRYDGCNGEQKCSFTSIFSFENPGKVQVNVTVHKNGAIIDYENCELSVKKKPSPPPDGAPPPDGGSGWIIEVTNPLTATDFKDFIDKLVKFLFTISLVIVPILLVVAGIMFVTAQGDPEKARKAKKMVLYTLIGFVIIALARILVRFIEQIFE